MSDVHRYEEQRNRSEYPKDKFQYLDVEQAISVCNKSDMGYYWDDRAEWMFVFSGKDRLFSINKGDENWWCSSPYFSSNDMKGPFLIEKPECKEIEHFDVIKDYPKLFLEFAEVSPTREGVLEFANSYGRLLSFSRDHCFVITPRFSSRVKKDVPGKEGEIVKRDSRYYREVPADTLGNWQREIRRMKLAVRLWEWCQENKKDLLKRVFYYSKKKNPKRYCYPKAEGSFETIEYFLADEDVLKQFHSAEEALEMITTEESVPFLFDHGCLADSRDGRPDFFELFIKSMKNNYFFPLANYLLTNIINQECRFIWPKLSPWRLEQEPCTPYLYCWDLLSAMWFQFYQVMTGEKRFKKCLECHLWEDVTNKYDNWSYHPECYDRKRAREYRAREKDKQKESAKKHAKKKSSKKPAKKATKKARSKK